jgi:multidrug efflux system membrane fusion protein
MTDLRSTRFLRSPRCAACAAFLTTLTIVATGCSGSRTAEAAQVGTGARAGGAAATVAVTTATAVERPMPVNVRAVGTVEPSTHVDVRSQVTGELLTVAFEEGQDVTAGQLLFTIDQRPFEAALEQAKAQLARDTALAEGADVQLRRSSDLLRRGLVAQADNDTSSTQAASLRALVAVDKAQVDTSRLQLQYTRIVAPVSGRTGALLVHRGSLVRATDASPLVVINRISPAFVSFAGPARLLSRIRAEQAHGALTVRAAPTGDAAVSSAGTVTFVDNAMDSATDTIRLKATFPNRDRRLWPGAFVDATLQLAVDPKAVVVPDAAVQASQQGDVVYVVKADHTVEVRPVTIAWTDAGQSVVQDGVRPGEVVVTDGQLGLTEGARVSVTAAVGAPATPAAGAAAPAAADSQPEGRR